MPYYAWRMGVGALQGCGTRWELQEHRLDGTTRLRLIGCGERDICPVCGTYRNDTLGYDAFELVRGIIENTTVAEGLPEGGGRASPQGKPSCWGVKVEFTLPASLSYELDRLLWEGGDGWASKVNSLFRGIYEVVRRFWGEGVAGVVGLHLSGETAPWEPHYHFPVYILPWLKGWKPIKRWQEEEAFKELRSSWKSVIEGVFGLKVDGEVDIKVGYIKTGAVGNLLHFLRYLFRHPLEDLWKGWRGFKDGKVLYEYRKKSGKRVKLEVPGEEVKRAFERLYLLPVKFKRFRWFGYLSDAQRGEFLKGLGFVCDEGEGDIWIPQGRYELINLGEVGATFRELSTLREVWVPIEMLCFCPANVLKKRKVWKPPGEVD